MVTYHRYSLATILYFLPPPPHSLLPLGLIYLRIFALDMHNTQFSLSLYIFILLSYPTSLNYFFYLLPSSYFQLFFSFLFFFFFGCAHGRWHLEVPGPGIEPYHSSDLSRSSENAGSLTHCATRELPAFFS